MDYFKKLFNIIDNYVIARWQHKPSTASFWYLPEPANIKTQDDLLRYQQAKQVPFYFIDYREKLNYTLENSHGIIVLPYHQTIGQQINPEAAFQYALGLHDQFYLTHDERYLQKFWHYADYFVANQTQDGLWNYEFDWFAAKAPWHSALAQARGASVMLRAWLQSNNSIYLIAAKNALKNFTLPTAEGGFLHIFTRANCPYFEEYPAMPTGVINGFMAALMSIWELHYWLREQWLEDLWQQGINSLQAMLPHYSNGWWSLYDLDNQSPLKNVNSPRYHLLEIHYLQILSVLSGSPELAAECHKRKNQYNKFLFRLSALGLKLLRKILYK